MVLGFFVMVGIGALFSKSDTTVIEENTVLRLDLERPILEVVEEDPISEALAPFTGEIPSVGIKDLRDALKKASSDSKIKGIYLKSGDPASGWAVLEEVRDALNEFKKSGKFIYAYSEGYSEKGYYLASVADAIYLSEFGDFEWNGLSVEYDFYKGTLDKLEIRPEVFRVGEFKSAVEPFLRSDMSEPSRKQASEMIGGINGHFLKQVSSARGISVDLLKGWADSLSIEKAADALQRKLVTNVGYYDEFEDDIKGKIGIEKDKKIKFIGVKKYLSSTSAGEEGDYNKRIAVVIADGEIVGAGASGDGVITAENLIKQLRKVRENDKVKAVVLRINSPGGSALASDLIWREVKLTAEKKPLIASMGNVAASGGYYIAMAADTIVAQPNTITGSIGIFGLMLNIEPFMKNKLGVTFDRVTTNPHSDWPTATRSMTDFEKQKIQSSVEHGYDVFTAKAAQGRKMSQDELKKFAEGRVWSGIDAKQHNLVDVLGGLDQAITLAAGAAGLKEGEYRVRYFPESKDWREELISSLTGSDDEEALSKVLGPLAPYAKAYQRLQRMEGIQARLPFEMRIN